MTTPPKESQSGLTQLGRYRLVAQIALGGMAEIYVAHMGGYAGSERLCVIKKIRPRIESDPRAVQMFLDEARIAATLQHPNIVQMFEVGEMDGSHFIAMEYLHGEDVRTLMRALRRQRLILPLDHAVHIVSDLLAGLHYAHEKRGIDGSPLGIVHRDVSPHNLFVTYDGGVKIVDFGIAKATNREHHTKVETLKGKIHYMSPEQCRCIALDHRSDIYSAAVVLYELTCGRRLNKGDDEYEIMKQTVEGPIPRPSRIARGYPSELETIVRKGLAKDPSDRFATALEMQQALENFAHDARLRRSSIELSRLMHELFGERITSWELGIADGTAIRELVKARHDGLGETSDSGDEGSGIDAPGGQLITLEGGPLGDAGRASPRATPETQALEPPDEGDAANGAWDAAEPESAAMPSGAPRPPRSRRLFVIAALILLASAAGVAVGLKLKNAAERETRPTETTTAQPTMIVPDGGTASPIEADLAAAAPAAELDAAVPPSLVSNEKPRSRSEEPSHVQRARLRVRGDPEVAIYIDGENRGTSPTTISHLAPGSVSVELRKDGYKSVRERVMLTAGKTATLQARLEREEREEREATVAVVGAGDLSIRTTPAAKIFVDGKSVGYLTDFSRRVPAGNHTVRLVVTELGVERSVRVTVTAEEATKVICQAPGGSYSCGER